jgi:hypothetical protein
MRKRLDFLSEQENRKQANGDKNRDGDKGSTGSSYNKNRTGHRDPKQEKSIVTEAKIQGAEIKMDLEQKD